MRILQINKYHYLKGGAERYYLDLSLALRERGHSIDHLAMNHPSNEPSLEHDRFVEEVDYRARMGAMGKLRQGFRTIWNPEANRLARELARREPRPAVAHLHNIYHQLSPSLIAALAGEGVPIVQTLHDYKLVCPAYLLMTEGRICERCRGGRYHEAFRHRCLLDSRAASLVGTIEAYFHAWRRTYAEVDRFLCPSRFLLEKIASFGISRTRLVHLPYFLDASRYRPALEPAARMVALYVGRLSREKGIATLIEGMARLPKGRLELEVLGDGPLRETLERRATEICPDRVRFLGFRSGEALHETIRHAAFAVVPSEWYENLPFAILETFALGRPVLGARIGGIPELVESGRTGRLFKSGDVDALAEALLWMTGPEADLGTMGREARRRIEMSYSVEPHLERLLTLYRELSANSAEGASA